MDAIHDKYIKKFEEISNAYGKMAAKLSDAYMTDISRITAERDAAVMSIDRRLAETNPEAHSRAINTIYTSYSEKKLKITEEWEQSYRQITTMYEHNKRMLNTAYAVAHADYARQLDTLNRESATKLKTLAVAALVTISPRVPRISTITSAR